MTSSIYDFNFKDLESEGFKKSDIRNLFKFLYKDLSALDKNSPSFTSKDFLSNIKTNFNISLPNIIEHQESKDGTHKFLMSFGDKEAVETVLIPFHKKYTICLSSQVGCAMGCKFCFTATQGYKRNLKASEILGQYIKAFQFLKSLETELKSSPNIVFMGQGEPLKNFTEVKKALSIFTDSQALHIGPRQITLSTVGYPPAMEKLSELPSINIALSLHSPFNDERQKIIPTASAYSISNIFKSLEKKELLKKQFITYEYLILKGINHSIDHANELASLLKDKKAIINLIAFNPFPGSLYKRPSDKEVEQFKNKLVDHGLRVMIRKTKGDEILAACGQLKSNRPFSSGNNTH